MGLISGFRNLSKVLKRLKHTKTTRAKIILRDYGLRELLRRVADKMKHGDAVPLYERNYVIMNESFLGSTASHKPFTCEQEVQFETAPRSVSIGKLEILTGNSTQSKDAEITLQMYDEDSMLLGTCTVSNIADHAYTAFDFMPVLVDAYYPVRFVFTSDTPGCGVLVNRKKNKHGFIVEGGGSVACKVYTQLDALYIHWLENNMPSEAAFQKQRAHAFSYQPKISIIVPLYNTPEQYFREMIDSLLAQTYANWELCLADGSTEQNGLAAIVEEYGDRRILYRKLDANEGISGNSNHGIAMATGDFVALLDHDDTLAPQALYENVALLNEDKGYDFIYSDEDKVSMDGSRYFDPFFKPDYSPDMLLAFNYITHFALIRKSLLDEVGYFDNRYNGAQDYDLFLRATERAGKIGHIDDILYHWRIAETSTAYSSETKDYTVAAGKAALEAAIERRGLHAHVEMGALPNYYNVVYDIPEPKPGISIIIPNHNEKDTLKKCVDSILRKSTYPNYEIIIVENNSTDKSIFEYYHKLEQDPRVRILTWNEPFNYSKINNYAAGEAQNPLLLFLNNDISVISPDWLEQMAMHALRPEIGAVGAKLYYPDDTLQHAGIVLRIGGVAGHSHKFKPRDEVGAFARLTLVHNVSAVTAACLMTRREVFGQTGGFDEQFVLAFNDVDLCLKINQLGYRIVWTPFAELYHFESKTRGYEETPEKIARFESERWNWYDKWHALYPHDPYYNRNLTHILEDYSIDPGHKGASLRKVTAKKAAD